jgi:hypothetical protein
LIKVLQILNEFKFDLNKSKEIQRENEKGHFHTGLLWPGAKWLTMLADLLAGPNGRPTKDHAGAARVECVLAVVTVLRRD